MIDHDVYLTQTDTTIGFVSQDALKLDELKGRNSEKKYITALPSLKALKACTRIPNAHKNLVRRAVKTTFVMPDGSSWRIIKDHNHLKLIKKLGWAYTTSANRSSEAYDESWARSRADVIVEPLIVRSKPSTILQLGLSGKIRRLR